MSAPDDTSRLNDGDSVYLVKYALSGKITKEVVSWRGLSCETYIYLEGHPYNSFKLGTEVVSTVHEAVAMAHRLRDRKIASMRKQIEKLEKRDFAKDVSDE